MGAVISLDRVRQERNKQKELVSKHGYIEKMLTCPCCGFKRREVYPPATTYIQCQKCQWLSELRPS